VVGALDVVSAQPFIGPFAVLLSKCVGVCNNFKVNQDSAQSFRERLEEVSEIVRSAMRSEAVASQHMDLLGKYITKLASILRDAMAYFESFTRAGFLQKLMVGSKPAEMFENFDSQLVATMQVMMAELAITERVMQSKTYSVACNIEAMLHDMGGYNAIMVDGGKLGELSRSLGTCSFFTFRVQQ
jgi:hypothetical protein